MGFFKREQLPIPEDAKRLLELIPKDFISDGCSDSPDSLFGFNFTWACKIHDWSFCTRCHNPGTRTYAAEAQANSRLKRHIDSALPFRWSWVKYIYYTAVWRYGGMGAYNSCGPEAGFRCRHGQLQPEWMKVLERPDDSDLKNLREFDKVTETETENGS